jgi:hypothetical protein
MDKKARNKFFVIGYNSPCHLVRKKPVMLSNSGSKVKIVNNCGINLPFLEKPSSGSIGPKKNRIVMLHAALPPAKRC